MKHTSDSNPRTNLCLVLFVLSLIGVGVVYWLAQVGTIAPTGRFVTLSWSVFYLSCISVAAYGFSRSGALESVVYLIALIGEAIGPSFSARLVASLDGPNSSEPALESACHLVLTLYASTLLLGWGSVLANEGMKTGRIPWGPRLYVMVCIFGSGSVLAYAGMFPRQFVNLEVVKSGHMIKGVWPLMWDIQMSYVRIPLTILTLFLPWAREKLLETTNR